MSGGASRPVNEIESAKTVADLKTSYCITGAQLQANFEVIDSRIANGLQKVISLEQKFREKHLFRVS